MNALHNAKCALVALSFTLAGAALSGTCARMVSRAFLNKPSVAARRETTEEAQRVIFRSTPNALNTSDGSGFPTLYGCLTTHHPKRV